MKFPQFDNNLTGVAVPVSTLRSEESCGIGEFLDLVPLGSFCKKTGIDLIQILPINDTGTQISPYSALSAYGLHPVYLRLSSLSGSEEFTDEIGGLRDEFEHAERISFEGVLKGKLKVCRNIYKSGFENIKRDEELVRWIEHNPWVKVYAVYKTVKSENEEKHWKEWKNMRDPEQEEVEEYWSSHTKEVLFHAWLQLNLEKQLKEAVDTLSSINVALKGDIPILMNEDSADVWMHRKYFRLDYRAGAPPDMYSDTGQNWGFPIYDWEALEREEFRMVERAPKPGGKVFSCIQDRSRSRFLPDLGDSRLRRNIRHGILYPLRLPDRNRIEGEGIFEGTDYLDVQGTYL